MDRCPKKLPAPLQKLYAPNFHIDKRQNTEILILQWHVMYKYSVLQRAKLTKVDATAHYLITFTSVFAYIYKQQLLLPLEVVNNSQVQG